MYFSNRFENFSNFTPQTFPSLSLSLSQISNMFFLRLANAIFVGWIADVWRGIFPSRPVLYKRTRIFLDIEKQEYKAKRNTRQHRIHRTGEYISLQILIKAGGHKRCAERKTNFILLTLIGSLFLNEFSRPIRPLFIITNILSIQNLCIVFYLQELRLPYLFYPETIAFPHSNTQ